MELHVGALVVVAGAGLVDVVGLHLVRPVHLTPLLVFSVHPGGSRQGLGLHRGCGGSWAHHDVGQVKPQQQAYFTCPVPGASDAQAHQASNVQEQLPLPPP